MGGCSKLNWIVVVLLVAMMADAAERPVVMGYVEYPPYVYRDAQGQMRGFSYEMIDGAARKRGVPLVWQTVTVAPEVALRSGKIDIWFGAVPNEERVKEFHFTSPFWQTDWLLLVSSKSSIRAPEETKGRVIAIQDVGANRTLFAGKLPSAKARAFRNPLEVMAAACDGRAEAVFADINYFHHFLLRRPEACLQEQFRFVPVPSAVLEVSLMSTRAAAREADKVREGIDHLAFSGETTEIVTKYLAGASGGTRFLVRAVENYRARLMIWVIAGILTLIIVAMSIFVFTMRRKNRVISEALSQAKEANRVKSQFVANMSHELRTPMNGVLGMLELINGSPLTGEQSEYLRSARVCGESLLNILNDILDLSKLRAGKPQIESERFSLEAVIADSVTICESRLQGKPDLHITVDYQTDAPVTFAGDAAKLRQVISNLVSNACKFTAQGSVRIQVGYSDSRLRVAVIDTGIGVPRDKQKAIFEEFHQADASTSRKFGGTGLGLSICKLIVEAMGGEIGVISEPGAGSEFWFRIPISPEGSSTLPWPAFGANRRVWLGIAHSPARQALEKHLLAWSFEPSDFGTGEVPFRIFCDHAWASANRTALVGVPGERVILMGRASDRQFWTSSNFRVVNLAFTPSALRHELQQPERVIEMELQPGVRAIRKRILLVEDNPINRTVARKMLERLGCEIEVAEDGAAAVAMVGTRHYDLIFMDCQMPVMDGFEATRKIRELEPDDNQTLIIALTANGLREDVERCLAAGMNSHLAKPVSIDALRKALSCEPKALPASFSLR